MSSAANLPNAPDSPFKGVKARRFTRSDEYQARGLNIEIRDFAAPVFVESGQHSRRTKVVSGSLIDLNETGLGLRTLCPLAVGATVDLGGEVHGVESCVRLEARVRVAHCRCQADGSFRVGLNFLDVKQQDLDCSHEPGFSLEGE